MIVVTNGFRLRSTGLPPEFFDGAVVAAPERTTVRIAGQQTTFEECFRTNYVRFVRTAYLILGTQSGAEDCVQEAFTTLHRKWDQVDDPAAYVRTVAINNARRVIRRTTVERRILRTFTRVTDTSPPEDPLLDALSRLTPRQRTALVLRYYEDFSEVEIARALSCAPGTVKSLLSRGLSELRVSLHDSNAESEAKK
jgi:RNA polymerase sigma-70 factor (sigma-E family)